MTRSEFETKLLANCREHQNHFHHCEGSSDAGSRAATKWKVRILRKRFHEPFCPPVRYEVVRAIIEARVTLSYPLKHENLRSGRNGITADLAIFNSLAAESVGGRIKPHRLFRDLFGKFQPWQVSNRSRASAQDLIKLILKFLFRLRMSSQQIP